LRERRFSREAQGTRAAGKPSGRFSFGYFSLAEQRKVPRPAGARARIKINRACKALLQKRQEQEKHRGWDPLLQRPIQTSPYWLKPRELPLFAHSQV